MLWLCTGELWRVAEQRGEVRLAPQYPDGPPANGRKSQVEEKQRGKPQRSGASSPSVVTGPGISILQLAHSIRMRECTIFRKENRDP